MFPEEVIYLKLLMMALAIMAIMRITRVIAFTVLAPWAEKRAAYKTAMMAAKVADKAERRRRARERRSRWLKAVKAWLRRQLSTSTPSLKGIEVEELTVDEEIVLATVEEPEETVPVIVSPEMAGPVLAERFVAAPATRADQARAKKARRERAARRPGTFVSRGRVGRYITVTYEVAGELATRCWDPENLEAFWLPGSPDQDPALAGFLQGRKALPPARQT